MREHLMEIIIRACTSIINETTCTNEFNISLGILTIDIIIEIDRFYRNHAWAIIAILYLSQKSQ